MLRYINVASFIINPGSSFSSLWRVGLYPAGNFRTDGEKIHELRLFVSRVRHAYSMLRYACFLLEVITLVTLQQEKRQFNVQDYLDNIILYARRWWLKCAPNRNSTQTLPATPILSTSFTCFISIWKIYLVFSLLDMERKDHALLALVRHPGAIWNNHLKCTVVVSRLSWRLFFSSPKDNDYRKGVFRHLYEGIFIFFGTWNWPTRSSLYRKL